MDPVIARWLAKNPQEQAGTLRNPHAIKFFAENPEAKYFYHSHTIRIPNPALRWLPGWAPDPWPTQHELLNDGPGCDCQ